MTVARDTEAQREPDRVKQPGRRPQGEVPALGIKVEIIEQRDEDPDTEQGYEHSRFQIFAGENKIRAEQQSNREDLQNAQDVATVVGSLAGAMQNNDKSLGQNIYDGQAAGQLSGTILAGLGGVALDEDMKTKYGGEIDRCNAALAQLKADREALADYLSKKYGSQFLNAY